MAKGNIRGPLGPIMLAMLGCVALFMIYAVNDPEMAGQFDRPAHFYDNIFEKAGAALLFALVVSALIALFRRISK